MDIGGLAIAVLAVWRVTHLLQAEDGPWDVVARLRARLGTGFWGRLVDCFQCLSLWVSAPAAWIVGSGWTDRVLLWLALSGGAILLERATGRDRSTATARYVEDAEDDDGLLWRPEGTVDRDGT